MLIENIQPTDDLKQTNMHTPLTLTQTDRHVVYIVITGMYVSTGGRFVKSRIMMPMPDGQRPHSAVRLHIPVVMHQAMIAVPPLTVRLRLLVVQGRGKYLFTI
jgi:hypothetical protein